MYLKKIAQIFLSFFGVRLVRISHYVEPVAPFDVLELAVRVQLVEKEDDFYFIQIGANDGVLADTLNPLIKKYQLRGCLVEPMKDTFNDLKRNYSDQTQLDFRQVMIGTKNGIGELHRFKRNAPVPANYYHGLARQDANYIYTRAKAEGLEQHIETLECNMQTFKSLLDSLPTQEISMLYIDTEGNDDVIIDSAFQAGIYPPVINYEWTEMSLERRYLLKMKLLDHGYRFIDVGADTVCVRDEHEEH